MNKFDEAKLIDLWTDHTLQTDQSFRDAQDEAYQLGYDRGLKDAKAFPTEKQGEMSEENKKFEELKKAAQDARLSAERAYYAYACEVDVGPEREYAFEVYERIRTATRRVQ